ncbi:hypothetical protein [Burkholderia ubonensis]|uniref:hypothetical protein n=1 Tax=Burkholderia ubonensis TaxID=101571 RepID=UPI000759B86B|nr:hypothetical protein [Burkholderia ubonensis]KVG71733.1 hypothetical protein WJ34_20380 [Burkholderia ubonensis]KVH17805.1 hypothetical protein WJ37_24720 [Burkholderia ubonensis]KVH42347.1 hypothetical protein WJ38_29325 [Burkholderia ubonensis]KVH85065.1 hypothetical protein WJ43_12745 [Burkholderia ubonensis]KVM34562.1 hypothetical protein WJ55_13695 [Burkholderia ubonensis]
MGRPLVQHNVCIDLPGEAVNCRAETELTVLLRKHRDVVFDVKLHAGATYTITTTHPDQPNGRFYDTKRKVNTGRTTFKDGERCCLWIGRTFEGSLILKLGEKVLGHYPIAKMDCTTGCTDDPKDKPAPLLIILHDSQAGQALAKDLEGLGGTPAVGQHPVPSKALEQSRAGQSGLKDTALAVSKTKFASAPVPRSEAKATKPRGGLPTIHAFKVTQTSGPGVPEEISAFFKSGARVFDWDPTGTLSRNWIVGMVTGAAGIGYAWDAFGPNGPLREFWNRKFLMHRNSAGEFSLLFSTSAKERKLLGYLLTTYQARAHDVRVMTLAAGTGSLSAPFRAAWEGVKGGFSFKTLTGRMFYFALAMDTAAWCHDYWFEPVGSPAHKDLADLLAILISDGLQAVLTTIFATIAYAVVLAFVATGTAIALPVTVIALGLLAVTWVFGIGVAMAFNHFEVTSELTSVIRNPREAMEKLNRYVSNLIREAGKLLEQQIPADYGNSYSGSSWVIFPVE